MSIETIRETGVAPQIQSLQGTPYSGLNSQVKRTGIQRVFVYGSLKRGFGNHQRHLGECRQLEGIARVDGLMFHLGAFPAINLSERFTSIQGEIYEVTWDKILDLDGLEGVANNFYSRAEIRVQPHGTVWTYIFPYERAAKEKFIVPSGVWRGPDTPKVNWLGFGKGAAIGSFETNTGPPSTIKVGAGDGHWELRRNQADSSYKLIDSRTGQVLGSYEHLRDMVGTDGRTKPVLRLPGVSKSVSSINSEPVGDLFVEEAIRLTLAEAKAIPTSNVSLIHQHPNLPIIWKGEVEEKEEPIPQAARLLGLKYGEA